MTSAGATRRRRLARVLLSLGAVFQIFLIGGLPVAQMSSTEMQSLVSLAALFTVSVGCAVSLRRWGRESVATLTVGSIFAIYLMVRLPLAFQQQLSSAPAVSSPAHTIAVVLALGTMATLPIALLVAWPLRAEAPELRDSEL